jgi:hypothetical protein
VGKATFAIAILGFVFVAKPQELPAFSRTTDETTLRKLMTDYSSLKDPFSAQFRRAEVREIFADGKTSKVWCGQVNAKNSNGGYVGWSDFVILDAGKKPIISIDDGDTSMVSRVMIDHLCKDSTIVTNP